MNSTSNEEGKQADNSYPLFLGASETQGTELSTLTVDTAITSPPKYTNTKRPATPSSVSTIKKDWPFNSCNANSS